MEPTPHARLPVAHDDPRTHRTQEAIIASFNALFLDRVYDRFGVSEIASAAGVGRSTFYEHFRNKDEVFARAALGVFGVLADAATPSSNAVHIAAVLDHINENRSIARAFFAGPSRPIAVRALADLIQARLSDALQGEQPPLIIPARLAAAQAAEAQIGLISAWLECPSPSSSWDLAAAIASGTSGLLGALVRR